MKQTDILLLTYEMEYIMISEIIKNILITHGILKELNIINKNFIFLILINNTSTIILSDDEKII